MTFEISIADYTLEIDVTHFFVQPPQTNADNDQDYYGYTDIEYQVLSGIGWDEELECNKVLTVGEIESIVDKYDDEIQTMIVKHYKELADNEDYQ